MNAIETGQDQPAGVLGAHLVIEGHGVGEIAGALVGEPAKERRERRGVRR